MTMQTPRRSLVCVALLTPPFLLMALLLQGKALAGAAEERVPIAALDSPTCARIDRVADAMPEEPLTHQAIDFHGKLISLLAAWAPVSDKAEADWAADYDGVIRKQFEVRPVDPRATALFDRLVACLPAQMKSAQFEYRLMAVRLDAPNAFTAGGGRVYIDAQLLNDLLANGERGEDMLAMLLAHELGHVALQHARRGVQLRLIMNDLVDKVDMPAVREVLGVACGVAGAVVPFTYNRELEYQADLFAVHLCRNAGINTESGSNLFRLLCLMEAPGIARDPSFEHHGVGDRSALTYLLTSHPDSFRRLGEVRREIAGVPRKRDGYGLYRVDVATGSSELAKDNSLAGEPLVIIFVHGIESGAGAFGPLMKALWAQSGEVKPAMLEFRYPNDGSLALAGELLDRETRRVGLGAKGVRFVCHSSGGLVFRYFAETKGGRFERAVFIGTPHRGSELASLRALLEVAAFAMDLPLGYPEAMRRAICDGKGQASLDLAPGSLFLDYLNRHPKPVDRYYTCRARALGTASARALRLAVFALRLAVFALRRQLRSEARQRIEPGVILDSVEWMIEQLRVTDEIADGDLAVSLSSAKLDGAAGDLIVDGNHIGIKSDPKVMEWIGSVVLTPPAR